MPYHTIPYHTLLYHTIPYHTIPNHPKPCRSTPYLTIPYQSFLGAACFLHVQFTPVASDFDLESLGFLVIWLDSSGEVVSSQATSQSKDVVNIGGTDVWWPW